MTAIRSATARLAAVAIGLVLLAPSIRGADSPLVQAMRDEIARAMAGLRLPGQPAPYFIACTIDDGAGRQIAATQGATVSDGRNRSRILRVDVRVGDYAHDSSRFVSFDRDPGVMSMYGSGTMQAPLDENVDVLRRQLWLVIDGAYRRALGSFAKKQAAQQNQASPDPVPDWSSETPRTTLLPEVTPAIALDPWVAHARALSAALARPGLTRTEVVVGGMQGTRYFVTSERTTTISPLQTVSVRLTAETQAADGMPLRDSVVAYARTVAGLRAAAAPVPVRRQEPLQRRAAGQQRPEHPLLAQRHVLRRDAFVVDAVGARDLAALERRERWRVFHAERLRQHAAADARQER